jgi:hypothetical protein
MPRLARITIYPIKSLNGLDVPQATVMSTGPLALDRRWAIVDAAYKFINGKQCGDLHRICAKFAPDAESVRLSAGSLTGTFELPSQSKAVGEFLSEILGRRCRLVENNVLGYPDDTDSPGPTIISTATIDCVAAWFANVAASEMRRRLRANLEVDATEPFWEDQLALRSDQQGPEFAIGSVRLRGWNICARCIVPTRDSVTGDSTPGFAKHFSILRHESLPAWSPAGRFDHFYRTAINTRLAFGEAGGILHVDDEVSVSP